MKDFILLMHADTLRPERAEDWEPYIGRLIEAGCFQGGSSIGQGQAFRKEGDAPPLTRQLTGYIKIQADSLEEASAALKGNPTYEAGGTVEIRELAEDGGSGLAESGAPDGKGAPLGGQSS